MPRGAATMRYDHAVRGPLHADILPLERRQSLRQEHLAPLSLRALAPESCGGSIAIKSSTSGACLGLLAGSAQSLAFMDAGEESRPFLLLLCLRGSGRIKSQKRILQLAEQNLCVFDMSIECGLEWRTNFDAVMLQIPRGPLASRLGRSRIDGPLPLGTTVAASAARSVLGTLAANIDTLEQADLSAGETAITELIASAILSELKAPNGSMTGVQADHFRRVAAAIESRLGKPDLALTDIARAEGMSARYVQRLFERRQEYAFPNTSAASACSAAAPISPIRTTPTRALPPSPCGGASRTRLISAAPSAPSSA